jgi:hypothetical protein
MTQFNSNMSERLNKAVKLVLPGSEALAGSTPWDRSSSSSDVNHSDNISLTEAVKSVLIG